MELSEIDIHRLVEAGYRREEFSSVDEDGISRLKNIGDSCFFYDSNRKRCHVYRKRPLGCQIYPIMFSIDDCTLVIDDLCPMHRTVSKKELHVKGSLLNSLLKTIDGEAETRLKIKAKDLK